MASKTSAAVRPFKIDLSSGVPHMIKLVEMTQLPEKPLHPTNGPYMGMNLDVLKELRRKWLSEFDWQKEEAQMNKFKHFTTELEGLNIHFIHERSGDPDAIPLLLLHGWPGSFLEFTPIIKQLTQRGEMKEGKSVSFDVIVPSLPGFAFSSVPPLNWTLNDTARIFNTLMTGVLGYEKYAIHGNDLGSGVGYHLYEAFTKSVRAAHFVMLPFMPMLPDELARRNVKLSPLEEDELKRALAWGQGGNGYFIVQLTRPNTIGLALQDNPLGQLAWLAEKFIEWSDPSAGSGSSILSHNEILRQVSLYYLTKSFTSSIYTYAQNPAGFRNSYTKAITDAPLLFSAFKYNTAFSPPVMCEAVGNLVCYNNHESGGHFPGLDNPQALIKDIRNIKDFWE